MIGEAATIPGAHISGRAPDFTTAVLVRDAIHLDQGSANQLYGVQRDDGYWTLGHGPGRMLTMPTDLVRWIHEGLAIIVGHPGHHDARARVHVWCLYNPNGQTLNIVCGHANVCVEGIDRLRILADWMGRALS